MSDSLQADFLGGYKLSYKTDQSSQSLVLVSPPTIKSQSLLAFLIVQRDHIYSRERLTEMFWGNFPSRKARRSLSTALWHIRRCFPDQNPIQGNSQSIQFFFDGNVGVDTDEFEKHVAQGTFYDLQEAIALYKGIFLDGFYDDWVINERYRLQSMFLESLAKLMVLYEETSDNKNALYSAQQLLELDPLREDAYRLLMRVYCALGQRNAALEQYRLCQKSLREELDVDPTPETSSLFENIQSGAYKIGQVVPINSVPPSVKTTPTIRSPLDVATDQILVGRENELTSLNEQWGKKRNFIMIFGEAGVGKTRLLETFAERVSIQGTRVLWGCCYEFEHRLPYQPIAEALRPSLDELSTEEMDQLPKWMIGELDKLIPGLLVKESKYDKRPSTNKDQEQIHLFEAVLKYLVKLADANRILLVLDDLHWVAGSTLELLHYLIRHIHASENQILIVGSYRQESLEEQHILMKFQRNLKREGKVQLLKLSSLSQKTVEQLLAKISGRTESIIPLANRLFRETEGNPFFLIETIKALFEMSAIAIKDGFWQGDFDRISQGDLPLPTSINEAIKARVLRMSEPTQEALRAAVIFGREFDLELLTSIWNQNEEKTLDAVDEMLRRRLIEEGEKEADRDYIFSHHKIQEVIYSEIPSKRRQHEHALAAKAIEKHFASQLEDVINELAHHYQLAQQLDNSLSEKAIHYLYQAGKMAAKQFANEDAVDYFSQALALIPEVDNIKRYALLLARERVSDVQGNREAQKDDLATLWELAQDMTTDQQAEVMLRQARLCREIGDFNAAIEAAQSAIDLAKADQQLLISEGNMIWGQALIRQGNSKVAQSRIKQGLDIARTKGAHWLEAYCLNNLGLSFHYLGDPHEARSHLEGAAKIYRQIEDLRGLSATLNNLGVIANEQGDNVASRSFYREALASHQKMGNLKGEGMVLGNLGVIAAAQGEYMQAKQDHQQALAIARKTGHQLSEGNALLNLGNVYLFMGAYDKASEFYDSALDVYRQIGNQTGVGWGLAYSSLHAHRLGNHETALTYAQGALHIAQEIGDRHIQGYSWTHLGHALLELGRNNKACEAYQNAVDLRYELDELHLAMESLSGLLRVYLRQNSPTKATPHLEKILKFLEKNPLEGVDEPLRVYLTCFQVLQASGDSRAHQLLTTAHTILQEQAANIEDNALRRTFLENVPAHREITAAFAGDKSSN